MGVHVTLARGDIRGAVFRQVVDGVDLAPILPGDTEAGLELIVDHCDDAANWAPGPYNPWVRGDHTCGRLADAVATRDNAALVAGLEEAEATYTPSGYRIVLLGFTDLILGWLPDDLDGMAPRAGWAPVVVDLGGHLTVTFRSDVFRRPGWVSMQLELDGAAGRYEPVHLPNMAACLAALRRQEAPVRLTSLARASEVVLEPGVARGHLTQGQGEHHGVTPFSVPAEAAVVAGLMAAMDQILR